MAARLLRRLLHGLITVLAAASFAFLLLQLAPGDHFSALYEHPGYTPQVTAQLRAQYGVDQPVAVQYVRWLRSALSGEFGWSVEWKRPVSEVLAAAFPNTLLLMSLALAASIIFGVLLGQWQALREGTRRERLTEVGTFVVYSMPEFWLAMLLLLVFAWKLGWFPVSGVQGDLDIYLSAPQQLLQRFRRLVLPWASLTLIGTAVFARFHRAAMRDALREPYVAGARARGLSERAVMRHARRSALTPVITLAGLWLPALVGGAVFVESVFSWNGMGHILVRAVHTHDYAVTCAIVTVGSAATVLASFLADVAREVADPRVRSQ